MLEMNIFNSVNGVPKFIPSELYRFYMDRDDQADNLIKRWSAPVKNALLVSVNLVKRIEDVYKEAMTDKGEDNDDGCAGDDNQ